MSQARFNTFLGMIQAAAAAANRKFTESRSSVKSVLQGMRQQLASGIFDLTALRPAIASARADKRGAKYEAALQYLERTWGTSSLQYKGPNEAGFTDVAGRLSVLKGTVVLIDQR